MFHSNTDRLTDYWRRRRGAASAPARSSIDPCDFAELLPQVVMLGRAATGRYLFRLGGAMVETLHGRGLGQADFLSLWAGTDRPRLTTVLENALCRGQAVVIEAEGHTEEGQSAQFEILMAPLSSKAGHIDRFLGLYQPTSSLSPLLGQPLDKLSVVQVLPLAQTPGSGARPLPQLHLSVLDGRRIA
jgi:hypothetical protein